MTFRFVLTVPFLLASLLAPCASMSATADDIDLSKIRCGDFVGGNKDDAILLLTWIEGYFAKKSDPPIIYGDKAKQHAEAIRDYCVNYGDATLFDAAKAAIK